MLTEIDIHTLRTKWPMLPEDSAGYIPTVEVIRMAKLLFSREVILSAARAQAYEEGDWGETPIGLSFSLEMAARNLLTDYCKTL